MSVSLKNLDESVVIILCTLPNDKSFVFELIKILLDCKLAACITLLNEVRSFYYWNDALEIQTEFQILIKTKNFLKESVFNKIKELHPYEIPELLVLPIIFGEITYLKWINSKCK